LQAETAEEADRLQTAIGDLNRVRATNREPELRAVAVVVESATTDGRAGRTRAATDPE
jgi:hypothetical protein